MKKIRYTGLAVSLLLVAASCSKYEDGPMVSLRSKKARVANDWTFVKVTDDGEDVTDSYDEFELTLQEDGDASLVAQYDWGDFSFEFETDGTWMLTDNKEVLELDFESDDADEEYQILRLTENELWLREKGGDREFELEGK